MIRAALLALAMALLAACDVYEPNNHEVAAPERSAEALEWAASEWAVRYPAMGTDYELPPVRWFDGDCLTWDLLPEPHACTTGMYLIDSPVGYEQIQLIAGRELYNTTAAHELLHWVMDRTTGDPDPNHTRRDWQRVIEVQVDLCEYLTGKDCQADEDTRPAPPSDDNGQPAEPDTAPPRSGDGTIAT